MSSDSYNVLSATGSEPQAALKVSSVSPIKAHSWSVDEHGVATCTTSGDGLHSQCDKPAAWKVSNRSSHADWPDWSEVSSSGEDEVSTSESGAIASITADGFSGASLSGIPSLSACNEGRSTWASMIGGADPRITGHMGRKPIKICLATVFCNSIAGKTSSGAYSWRDWPAELPRWCPWIRPLSSERPSWHDHDNIMVLALWTPTDVKASKETERPTVSKCFLRRPRNQITPLLRVVGTRKTGRSRSLPTSLTRKSGSKAGNWCLSAKARTVIGYHLETQDVAPSCPRNPSVKKPKPKGMERRLVLVLSQ